MLDSMISQREGNNMNASKMEAMQQSQHNEVNNTSTSDLMARLPLYADPDRVYKLKDYLKKSVSQVNHQSFTSKQTSKTHRLKDAVSTPKLSLFDS